MVVGIRNFCCRGKTRVGSIRHPRIYGIVAQLDNAPAYEAGDFAGSNPVDPTTRRFAYEVSLGYV